MRIFVDLHHQALHRSLQILFEKRLGHELFRPIGIDWFSEGYWKIAEVYNNHPDTIKQFLGIRDTAPSKEGPRNVISETFENYYITQDSFMDHKAITFQQFEKNPPDVVIASYYGNIEVYKQLAQRFGCKFIMQMGNNWPVNWNNIDNLMSTNKPIKVPTGKNAVFHHQEFDQEYYRYEIPDAESKIVRSFVHCMMEHKMHEKDWEDFQKLETQLPEFEFESYGTSCRDGVIRNQSRLGNMMRESRFGVQFKNHGDGYGHVIHNWFAVGRPVIFKGSQYKGKLAGDLLIDGVTGFDWEKGNTAQRIKDQTDTEYEEMCANVFDTFAEEVNFETEAKEVEEFLLKLI